MYIYKTTCLINNKVYIGQSSKLPDKSKTYYGSGIIIMMVIKRYGKENFIKEILRVCKTQKELDLWEMIYIKKYKSCDEKYGYNILPGSSNGFGNCNPSTLPAIRKRFSIMRKGKFLGKDNPNYGNKWSDERKRLFSENVKEQIKNGRIIKPPPSPADNPKLREVVSKHMIAYNLKRRQMKLEKLNQVLG